MAARGRRRLGAVLGALALVGAVAGYGVADATGRVPGPLTQDPVPQPYPELVDAPGAGVPPATPAPVAAAPLANGAPLPDPAVLAAATAPALADPALGPAVSATVVDALTGAVLLDAGAGTGHEPASVLKLLTAVAALNRLGAVTTVDTTAVTTGDGPVVLVGGGDVLLSAGPGDPTAANGHASLADLADQSARSLLEAGRTSVVVALDDSLFEGVGSGRGTGPGVSPSDISNGFVAPVTAVAVDAGRTTPENYAPRVADPGLAAAATFAALLAERGVSVQGTPERVVAEPGATVLGTVTSAPLSQVVAHVLAVSDNNGAEALARLVAVDAGAGTDFAGAGAAVLAEVAGLGVPVDGLRLADGSGLADGSVLTPAALAGVLRAAADPGRPDLRPVLTGLPVAGLSGTLAPRFAVQTGAVAGQGLVRAKTGSLTGTTSLAGTVVDADGRLLVFAVMADRVPASLPGRAAADRFVATLAGCGCR